MLRRIRLLFMSVSCLTYAGLSTVHAQEQTGVSKSPLTNIYKCAAITEDTARLACFDEQVASLQVKEEKKEIVAIDADSAKKIKREAFGFSLPSLPKLGLPSLGGGGDEGPDVLQFSVRSVSKRGGSYVFHMDNGQVWRQAGGRFNYIPKGDLTATIKSGAIGSYMISLDNGKERVRGMRVKRIE